MTMHEQIDSLLKAGKSVRSSALGRAQMDITGVDGNSVYLQRGNRKFATTFNSGDAVKIVEDGKGFKVVNI